MRTLSASIPPVLNRESLLPAGSVAAEVRDSRKPEYWLPEMRMDGDGVKLSSLEHPKTNESRNRQKRQEDFMGK